MAKQMMFQENARAHLKDGLAQLAAAVKVTLGPTGQIGRASCRERV